MLFNSLPFLVFFPTVTAIYFLAPARFQNVILLVASAVFYAYLAPLYLLLFLGLILLNFVLALQFATATNRRKRTLFGIGVVVNLVALCAFKYAGFFNTNLAALAHILHWNYGTFSLQLVLPIGLSFVVFQGISYLTDVYRGTWTAATDPIAYALYMLFFPKLLAGPIERAAHLLPQITKERSFEWARIKRGADRMLWGFFKKLVIADNIALLVNHVYASIPTVESSALALLALLYPFQMYADFSGYSDIAIGCACMLGIDLSENFNRPFASRSFTEYWQRWHISLSSWLRDYLYYPLATSKASKLPGWRYVSIFVTFVLSGVWHGATGTYLAFGVFNGSVRVANSGVSRTFKRVWSALPTSWIAPALQILCTFVLTMVSLVFFSTPTIGDAWFVLTHALPGFVQLVAFKEVVTSGVLGISATTLGVILASIVGMEIVQFFSARGRTLDDGGTVVRGCAYAFLLFAIFLLGNLAPIPFIYFKF